MGIHVEALIEEGDEIAVYDRGAVMKPLAVLVHKHGTRRDFLISPPTVRFARHDRFIYSPQSG